MAADIYMEKLKETVTGLEELYGLMQNNADGIPYMRMDIEDVMEYVNSTVSGMPDTQRVAKNTQAGRSVVLLCYLNHRLKYFGKSRLDYSAYPRADVIAEVLRDFLKKVDVTEVSVRNMNKLITILASIDKSFAQHKMGLAYKYLRLFVIMVVYGNYGNAGVLADLIINQLILGVEHDR